MCPALLSRGLGFCDQHPCLLPCMSPPCIPTPHITCNSPSPFQSLCFLSFLHLSCTQLVTSSVVSDLNTDCRAVTSSCTALPTLLLFTATATHLRPSGSQYCYHYTPVLSLLYGLITLYNEGNMIF
jgi:hypothetical protein